MFDTKLPWRVRLFAHIRWLVVKLGLSKFFHKMASNQMNQPTLKRRLFAHYQPTEHDVFVCVHGKSGTNWTLQIVTQIAHRGAAEFQHIHDIVPWPDAPMPGIVPLTEPTHLQAPTGLRAIKTHIEAQYVPYNPQTKYIVVIRDPKDVLVSGYYFNESMFPGMIDMPVEEWAEVFISGRSVYGSWSAQVTSYWHWRDRENVLILYYGQMKQDLSGTVQRIAEFMGVSLTESEFALVMEKSSFAYMKQINEKFAPPIPAVGDVLGPVMIRSGKKGGYQTLLTPTLQEKVDCEMMAQLEAAGSDFPYKGLFAPSPVHPLQD